MRNNAVDLLIGKGVLIRHYDLAHLPAYARNADAVGWKLDPTKVLRALGRNAPLRDTGILPLMHVTGRYERKCVSEVISTLRRRRSTSENYSEVSDADLPPFGLLLHWASISVKL